MNRVHFIAIGGSVMHNLAIALQSKGYEVSGSDDEFFEPSRSRLASHGLLPDETGWHPDRITTDIDAIILGMHATEDNPELQKARQLNLKIYSFPDYIYEQTQDKKRIVVGGSHGKTTTTAMIMHVLNKCGILFDHLVGAQLDGFDTMVGLSPESKIAIFEGDEYLTSALDRTSKFLHYHANVAIITGIAWDHVNVFPTFDSYVKTFSRFAHSIMPGGRLIYYGCDRNLQIIANEPLAEGVTTETYQGLTWEMDSKDNVVVHIGGQRVELNVFGDHNMQNMHAALLACRQCGISDAQFADAIKSFNGASRRLQMLRRNEQTTVFLDFAHSPSKLRATINAVRGRYPHRRIVAFMELHTFSSLTLRFLPQYSGTMDEADVAVVYFNSKTVENKHLAYISSSDISTAFGHRNMMVLTLSGDVSTMLRNIDLKNSVLILMTSGNFGGIDIQGLVSEIVK